MLKKRYLFLIMIIFMFIISTANAEEIDNYTINENNQLSVNMEDMSFENNATLSNEEIIGISNDNSDLKTASENTIYFDSSAASNGDGTKSHPFKYVNQNTLNLASGKDLTAYFANGIYDINTPFKISSNVVLIGENTEKTIFNSVLSNKYDFEIMENSNLNVRNISFNHVNFQNHGTIEAYDSSFVNSASFTDNNAPATYNIKDYSTNEEYDSSFVNSGSLTDNSTPATYNTKDYGSSYGGVIICDPTENSNPLVYLENCIFDNNTAYCGGAISLKNSYLIVKSSKFINNNVEYLGGVIYSINSDINISYSECDMNTAGYGGVIYSEKSDIKIFESKLYNSYTYSFGGVIASKYSNIDIQSCDLTYYMSSTDAGGAIYNFKGKLNINKTYLRWGFSQYGGAIANLDGNLTLNSCYLYKNTAENGGAIYNIYGQMDIKDNTFYVSRGHLGSVIHSEYTSEVYLINNIIVNSTSNNADPLINLGSFDNIHSEGNHFEDVYYYYLEISGYLNDEKVTLRSNVITYVLSTTGNYEDIYDKFYFDESPDDTIIRVYDSRYPNNSTIYGNYNDEYTIMCNFTDAPDNIRVTDLKYYVCNSMGEIIFNSFHQDKSLVTIKDYGGFFCLINGSSRILSNLGLDNNVHNANVPLINSSSSDLNYIPSYYNSNDYGYITPVKNQGIGGNCWAFAGIATLEACIKKITNITYDFSEENAKNSMAIFSSVGLEMNPNSGGFDSMFLGYLANWYGPVLEDWDTYDDLSSLSPLFISKYHIQNVEFLPERDGSNDNIYKKAIMDYGAITVGFNWLVSHSAHIIGWDDNYNNFDSFGIYGEGAWIYNKISSQEGEDNSIGYISYETIYDDSYKKAISDNGAVTITFYPPNYHSVSIVGWDDNYNNNDSMGIYTKGAWIFKNSWGTDWGNNGFGYLSYNIPFLSDYYDNFFAYTFTFNENDYHVAMLQDGLVMTDYISNYGPIYCVLNGIGLISGWGIIPLEKGYSGFSTYFLVPTNYTVSIYNIETDELLLNQTGHSEAGYHTIAFDKVISREYGDNFKVVIGYCNEGLNYLPVSVVDDLTKVYSRAGYTFCSFDGGKTFIDLFGYNDRWQEPCIQIFTKIGEYYHTTFNINISEFDNINIGENITINITLMDNSSEISYIYEESTLVLAEDTLITININGKDYFAKIHDGKASLEVSFDKAGQYMLTAEYKSNRYDSEIVGFNFTVNQIDTNTTIFSTVNNPNTVTLTANVNSPSVSGNITFIVNGKEYTARIYNGIASYTLSNLTAGSYIAKAIYEGNENFHPSSSANISFIIGESRLYISAPDVTKTYGESEKLDITVIDKDYNAANNVELKIKLANEIYTKTTDSNGKVSIDLNMDSGNYTAEIIFEGNGKYNKTNTSAKITINKITTKTNLTSTKNSQNTYSLTADIYPSSATGEVIFTVNDKNYTAEIKDSKATYLLSNLEVGPYTVRATYKEKTNYKTSTSKNILFNVEKTEYDINSPDLTKYYKSSERFIVTVKKYNNPVVGKNVTINLNGIAYVRTTNENGEASMAINLNSGVYKVTSEFEGIEVESTITIKTTISSSNVTKIFKNGTQYYGTFSDSQGNLLKNTDVKFNINGVFYTRTTNENGIARMNINLAPGTYILTAENPTNGEMQSAIITVLPSIVENNDLTKYFKNESKFTFRLLDDQGNPVGEGITAKLNINGVFYTRSTNASGYVNMNINLAPGTYIVTIEYNSLMRSNTISVLPILEAKNIYMSYHDGTKFEVKLLDGKGNAFANQTITFNINGVFYDRITDNSGVARLNINLMPGEYIITSMYVNGAATSNKVTIKS